MEELEFPIIICTEFVVNGMTEYRMAKWVDTYKISSFENHRNDHLCDIWLAPIPEPIPEPSLFGLCEEGSIETSSGCITFDGFCGENATYQDGICVGSIPRNNTSNASDKWDDAYANDSCPVYYILNYAWVDCGSIITYNILGIPLLVIIFSPIVTVLAFIIWRIRK
jgi:hypothetical protein